MQLIELSTQKGIEKKISTRLPRLEGVSFCAPKGHNLGKEKRHRPFSVCARERSGFLFYGRTQNAGRRERCRLFFCDRDRGVCADGSIGSEDRGRRVFKQDLFTGSKKINQEFSYSFHYFAPFFSGVLQLSKCVKLFTTVHVTGVHCL